MEQILVAFVIFMIFLIIWQMPNTKKMVSGLDGENYYVIPEYDDMRQAVNTLARVNQNIITFLTYLKDKYKINHIIANTEYNYDTEQLETIETQNIVNRLLQNYNFEVIHENEPTGRDGTSYTLDKGDKLVFCLRNKKTLKIHDMPTLMFVALHEVSHMGNATWGHDRDFWETFKFVLHEAKLSGVHTPIDYKKYPVSYCGMTIDYSPYFDRNVRNLWQMQ